MNQDLVGTQDSGGTQVVSDSNSFSTTKGYATGTVVPISGTYRASNKYLDLILAYAANEIFLPFSDGKKCTWYALSPSLSSNSDGSFSSVKVAAGTI
ncbi:MAG TPA: hypothetical protein VGK82_12315 [Pyrinomonadaceae bacterium]